MKIGILTIGDELLSGSTHDLNSYTLAKILFKEGVKASTFRTCSDSDIEDTLKQMLKDHTIVITSGGLGPTHDDLTAESIAAVAGVDLVMSEEVLKDLSTRYTQRLEEVKGVARIPDGATPLINKVGSAPGFVFTNNNGHAVIAMPGVPYELEDMAKTYLPHILDERRLSDHGIFASSMHFCHAREDLLAPVVSKLALTFPEFEFGIYPHSGSVSVVFRGKANDKRAFLKSTEGVIETLYDEFPTLVFPAKHGSVTESVLSELKSRNETLVLAESCTGGEMAASITKIPGASDVFLMGVVTYSNDSKHRLLNISKKTLDTYGAVSEEVVIEMVEGLFSLSNADYAIAVSGIAGPGGGTVETPVGTVWGAVGKRGGEIRAGLIPNRKKMRRDVIIRMSTNYMFGALWRLLAYDICPFT